MDHCWENMMPWKREAVEWGWLNSHYSLTEGSHVHLKLTPHEESTAQALYSPVASWYRRHKRATKKFFRRNGGNIGKLRSIPVLACEMCFYELAGALPPNYTTTVPP